MGAEGEVRPFRRRLLLLCAAVGWAPALAFGVFAPRAALGAYVLTFLLVSADFLWLTWSFAALFRPGSPARRATARALAGFGLRMVLLLLGLYGIVSLFPRELLGVCLGIGTPLSMAAVAGALPARGEQ